MPSCAQLNANRENAQSATGPRSDEGKSTSSKNGITLGLYTAADYIRPGEQSDYDSRLDNLFKELAPRTTLEREFVAQIHRAHWRLRRCSLVEAQLSADANILDPMRAESPNFHTQLSLDRARAQASRQLRLAMAELRRLQTERQFRVDYFVPGYNTSKLGLTEVRAVCKDITDYKVKDARAAMLEVETFIARNDAPLPKVENPQPEPAAPEKSASLCKNQNQPHPVPRNATCPCGSGQKHKRCCGKNAPPVLQQAA